LFVLTTEKSVLLQVLLVNKIFHNLDFVLNTLTRLNHFMAAIIWSEGALRDVNLLVKSYVFTVCNNSILPKLQVMVYYIADKHGFRGCTRLSGTYPWNYKRYQLQTLYADIYFIYLQFLKWFLQEMLLP